MFVTGCSKEDFPSDGNQDAVCSVAKLDYSKEKLLAVLKELYNTMDGEHWATKVNWEEEENMEDWTGVRFDNGELCIYMRQWGLNGVLPESLFDLPLAKLDMGGNGLEGEIPANAGKNGILKELILDDNVLTGTLPESLAESSLLYELDVKSNKMSGTIPEKVRKMNYYFFFKLKQVEGFGFDNAERAPYSEQDKAVLKTICEKLTEELGDVGLNWADPDAEYYDGLIWDGNGRCTGMRLSGMDGVRLPVEIQELTELKELTLDGCLILPFPEMNLPKLEILKVTDGDLFEFPKVEKMPALKCLELRNVGLKGEIPEALSHLVKLEFLDLSYNFLDGMIPDMKNLKNLRVLNLAVNSFLASQPLPEELGYCPNLEELDVSQCNFIGTIPSSYANLTNLYSMNLIGNLLNESIEKVFAGAENMKRLRKLVLKSNYLTGNLPEFHQNMQLEELDLSNNNFTGTLPENWKFQKSLITLDLEDNQISGTLPLWLLEIPGLANFNCQSNLMAGTFDRQLLDHDKFHWWDIEEQHNGSLKPAAN